MQTTNNAATIENHTPTSDDARIIPCVRFHKVATFNGFTLVDVRVTKTARGSFRVDSGRRTGSALTDVWAFGSRTFKGAELAKAIEFAEAKLASLCELAAA